MLRRKLEFGKISLNGKDGRCLQAYLASDFFTQPTSHLLFLYSSIPIIIATITAEKNSCHLILSVVVYNYKSHFS